MILAQVSRAMEMVIGPRVHHYLDTISETTRAVVYGVGLTAVAQAIWQVSVIFICRYTEPNAADHGHLYFSPNSIWHPMFHIWVWDYGYLRRDKLLKQLV